MSAGRFVALMLLLCATSCAQSHAADGGHPGPSRDAGLDAGADDAGDHVPGNPDDIASVFEYCIRIVRLIAPRDTPAQNRFSCRDARLSCALTVAEVNHCLDVARSVFDGTPLDVTSVPACHDMCPHPDGG